MSDDFDLDDKIMDFFEEKLNEMVNEAENSFDRSIGGELALSCASLAAQLAVDGGSSEKEFMHFMKAVYKSLSVSDQSIAVAYSEPTAAQKKLMN